MTKIESFKTFSQLQSQLREEARQKEVASKREASVAAFNELLSKYNASSIADVNEEEMEAFMSELTAEGNAFGDAVRKAKEAGEDEFEFDGKTYKVTEDEDEEVEEGNAFGDAVRKAKEAGEEEFEFDGKTYKVTEASVTLDTTEPDNKNLVKFLKKHKIEMKKIGGFGDFEEFEYTGKAADLKKLIDQFWEDDYLYQYIEEGRGFVAAAKKAKEEGKEEFEWKGKKYPVLVEGNAFGDAVRKAKEAGEEEFEFDGKTYKVTEEESILESNKRQVAAVVKSFSTYSAKMPVFKMMNDESLLWFIRETVKEALVCANFHTEANMVPKYIKPAKLGSIEIKPAELGGNIYMKVPKKVIMDLVQVISSNVCAAAKYDGYAIIEGAAGYLDTIRPGKKSAEGLRAALAALQA